MYESPVYNIDFGTETGEIILKTVCSYIVMVTVYFSDTLFECFCMFLQQYVVSFTRVYLRLFHLRALLNKYKFINTVAILSKSLPLTYNAL